jgi:hypothetical protein
VSNNELFASEPIKRMSKLTFNLLHGIDYKEVKRVRTENFHILMQALEPINKLEVYPVEGAFMYPLLLDDAENIKRRLLERKIYIPTLWPNVLKNVPRTWIEWQYTSKILPIPCDQRYDIYDMYYLVDEVNRCIN